MVTQSALGLFLAAALGLAVAALVGAWLAFPVRVTSNSMAPWAWRGDYGVAVYTRDIRRGDVIAFRFPFGAPDLAIKRAVALAGDCVPSRDGRRTTNAPPGGACEVVPPGTVFVVGDNAGASVDSRSFGPVPAGEIVGKMVLLLPITRWLPR